MSAEWADQPAAPDNQGVPGKTLAAQREALGWTVEQVADQLKLAVRQVRALEAGDYAALPGPAVVRGFVRAYAKVVKLDAAPLVAMIALETPAASDATSTTVKRERPASFSEVRFPTNGKRASRMPVALISGVLLVAAAGIVLWQFDLLPKTLLGDAPVATAPVAAPQDGMTVLPPALPADRVGNGVPVTPPGPLAERAPVITNSVPLISVPPPPTGMTPAPGTGSPLGVAPAGVNPAPAPAPAAVAPAAPAASRNALVLNVRESSWIEVRPAKGKALFSGLVKGGSVETIEISQPVTLIVGRPGAVDASLRGAPLPLPRLPGGNTSRVELK